MISSELSMIKAFDHYFELPSSRFFHLNPYDKGKNAVDIILHVKGQQPFDVSTGHLSIFSPNALGFIRAVDAQGTSKKTLLAFEIQSDVSNAFKIREVSPGEYTARFLDDQFNINKEVFTNKEEAQKFTDAMFKQFIERHQLPHALHTNSILLKTAMAYAIRNGYEAIAIPGAKSAMQVQGQWKAKNVVHISKNANGQIEFHIEGQPPEIQLPENIKQKALAKYDQGATLPPEGGYYVPQENGMIHNYDMELPAIAERLTEYKSGLEYLGEAPYA